MINGLSKSTGISCCLIDQLFHNLSAKKKHHIKGTQPIIPNQVPLLCLVVVRGSLTCSVYLDWLVKSSQATSAHCISCITDDLYRHSLQAVVDSTEQLILRVSTSISGAAVAGAQFTEGDQLQVKFILQLSGLLPQICNTFTQKKTTFQHPTTAFFFQFAAKPYGKISRLQQRSLTCIVGLTSLLVKHYFNRGENEDNGYKNYHLMSERADTVDSECVLLDKPFREVAQI